MDEDQSVFGVTADYATQWSRLADKPKTRPKRATYSRRGSMNNESTNKPKRKFLKMKRRSSTGSERSPLFSMPNDLSATDDQFEEEQGLDMRLSGAIDSSRSNSIFHLDNDDFVGEIPPPPVPQRRKTFRRANSVSDVETVPNPPPVLKRSQSVTASAMSASNLASLGGIRRGVLENFNPNFFPLEESISPKRGCIGNIEGSKRKKSRFLPSRSFADNEYLSLNRDLSRSNFAHDPDEFDSPQAPKSSRGARVSSKNPRVLQRGHSLPVLPSIWAREEEEVNDDDDSTNDFASTFVSTTVISARKRGPTRLNGIDFGASPPPQQPTAKSRTSSSEAVDQSIDLPTPLNEIPATHYTFRTSMSSDDEALLSDSEMTRSTACSDRGETPSTSKAAVDRKILLPENASVDDVVQTMSSEMDLRFLCRAMALERNQPNRSKNLWKVALAASWTAERRNALLHWATDILGFKYVHVGGNVYIMQILSDRGKPLLELFQKAIASWDNCKPLLDAALPREFVVASPGKKAWKCSQSTSLLKSEGSVKPMHIDTFANSLADHMKNLTMEEKPDILNQRSKLEVMIENEEIVGETIDVSRPSLDHHTSSIDLMSHMHGTTPIRPRQQGKPPRMSMQSTVSNVSMASPFPVMNFVDEFVSTPRIDVAEECWGSCTVDGRDWGSSDPCDTDILGNMLEDLDRNSSEFDLCDSSMNPPEIGLKTLDFDRTDFANSKDCDFQEFEKLANVSFLESSKMEISSSPSGRVQFDVAEDPNREIALGTTLTRDLLRREKSLAKRRRTALFASAKDPVKTIREARKSMFVRLSQASLARSKSLLPESCPEFFSPNKVGAQTEWTREPVQYTGSPFDDRSVLERILDFLQEEELLLSASLVSKKWFEAATNSHANLMLSCVGCDSDNFDSDDCLDPDSWLQQKNHALSLMERPWKYLTTTFPWASFLSEGAYKKVYKVFNHKFRVEEAISVMDVEQIRSTGNMSVVGAELAVSVLLSSLVRRGVCPNFVSTRGVFSCPFQPPKTFWGSAENNKPRGNAYDSPQVKYQPEEPTERGRYQYIRMELCDEGDAEEFLKRQPDETVTPCQARHILFQIAFALHAGAEKFSLKHYDLKLLNVFLRRVNSAKNGEVVLRYGLGEHIFSLKAPKEDVVIAKLADYGTAKVDSTSNGQQVTIAQFTTLENTPPDFMILGDEARQGHSHDNFGLGLCMLHLFTGHAPYEEILEDVVCPPNFLNELRKVWENDDDSDYTVVRSLVLSGVFKDDDGHILEGEPDEVLYHTIYKFLVLFGIPDPSDQRVLDSKVMTAIKATLVTKTNRSKKGRNGRKARSDAQQFSRDRKKYSLSHGNNVYIARAREALMSMDGGMELLLSLVQFNPEARASALDVLNSSFMAPLREMEGCQYSEDDDVMSFTALATR